MRPVPASLTGLADPLDAAHLRSLLTGSRQRSEQAHQALVEHLRERTGYVSWSGGKDSTAALVLTLALWPQVPVCFFDSGLEFPETLTYIHDLAERWCLNLHVMPATPDALAVMAATGAWDHHAEGRWDVPDLHEVLVSAPARQARATHGAVEVWGLRAQESVGRRALLSPGAGRTVRADGTRVLSPVWNWREGDVTGFLASQGVPLNPVYAKLSALGASGKDLRVGLMIDGNQLHHGRALWVKRGWPDQWERMAQALPRLREWA